MEANPRAEHREDVIFPDWLGNVSASGGREVPEREGSLSRSVWKMDGGCFLLLNQQ